MDKRNLHNWRNHSILKIRNIIVNDIESVYYK